MSLHWENKDSIELQSIDKHLQACLFHTGSLMRFLQEKCNSAIELEVLTESWRLPFPDETRILNLQDPESTFIRESWLKSNKERIVYARTVIPEKTIQGQNKDLTELGTTPLGEILFADESTRRTNVHYAKITEQCDLFNIIKENANEPAWARQSLFYIQNKPLLVSEVFLPSIIKCIKN